MACRHAGRARRRALRDLTAAGAAGAAPFPPP
ncbi:twin-arginine translocation signal domain-containing protein [Burkholderia latens]|uniref:Twin-arginine translocation signal domain-containing protein n=1 Tax=Burkholderia latens TaxID=488446 RepID=A0A6H9TAN2_9BURK|nr:twin-arginine translocation signal domain-containing protein [Burkholderia latens]